jgi:ketosteroid isomerase-like protein
MRQVSLAEVPEELGTEFAAADAKSPATEEERANAESLQRMLHAIAGGRFDELRELLAPDVAFELAAPPRFPWTRRAAGQDAVVAAIAHNFSTVRDQMPHPLTMVARDDTVMIMARETGRLVETGEAYQVLLAHQFTFRDGRLAHFRSVSTDDGPA